MIIDVLEVKHKKKCYKSGKNRNLKQFIMNKVKITIGDWSQDGHNQYEEFVFETNKTSI